MVEGQQITMCLSNGEQLNFYGCVDDLLKDIDSKHYITIDNNDGSCEIVYVKHIVSIHVEQSEELDDCLYA